MSKLPPPIFDEFLLSLADKQEEGIGVDVSPYDAFIIENYRTMTPTDIAAYLGTNRQTVMKRGLALLRQGRIRP